MADMNGTNPVTGDDINVTNPGTLFSYLVGGIVIVGSLVAGKFVTDSIGESTGVGDTVSENIPMVS